MSKLSNLSDKDIHEAIAAMQNGIAIKPDGEEAKALQTSIDRALEELQRRAQKKSEAQSQPIEKVEQLPTKAEMQEWATKEEKWNEVREKLPAMARAYDETIKTVEAPDFVAPDELINVKLEDSKGNKQIKTFSKAQVRALARKYFSNVHESWLGKERKMGVGFKNLLAYVVAWKEFDSELPTLRDVLPDYDRYKKAKEDKEASNAFKVAEELYSKIVEILKP